MLEITTHGSILKVQVRTPPSSSILYKINVQITDDHCDKQYRLEFEQKKTHYSILL